MTTAVNKSLDLGKISGSNSKNQLNVQRNPFAFDPQKANQNIDKKSLYIPPHKRKEMKDFLSNSSINMKHETSVSDKNYD